MSSTDPSLYGFLPYIRRGLANNITQEDLPSSPLPQVRATINVTAHLDGAALLPQDVELIGPIDILNIAPDVILRTEPMEHVYDFDANLLPFIEFYEEDFLWRYTPAKPVSGTKKLRPWLALMVLKNDEFTINFPTETEKPPYLTVNVNINDVLHPNDQHWAFAHVQVNNPLKKTAQVSDELDNISDLITNLPSDPERSFCRLLSSRKLEKDTEYTAFLIPAFEAGRLAGLGELTAGIDSLLGSWTASTTTNVNFPIYKQWRFGTSSFGDFETLARKLKPCMVEENTGSRFVDISDPGMGLNGSIVSNPLYPTDAQLNGTINLEGTLAPSNQQFDDMPDITVATPGTFLGDLLDKLNLQSTLSNTLTSLSNPYSGTDINIDPIILPPIFGQYHANASSINSGSELWMQQLNLDIRNRIAAGVGSQIVKEKQEAFMEIVWKQLGEVNIANDKIRKAQFAMEASYNIYNKHLIGDLHLTSTSDDEKFDSMVKIASYAMKKIKIAPSSFDPTLRRVSIDTTLSKATVDGGFRKLSRNNTKYRKISNQGLPNLITNGLNPKIEDATVTVNPLSNNLPNGSNFAGITITFSNLSALFPSTYSNPTLPSNTPIEWLDFHKCQYYDFKQTLTFFTRYNFTSVIYPRPNGKGILQATGLPASTFVTKILTDLNPENSIKSRIVKTIVPLAPIFAPTAPLKTVMAYPKIDIPMSKDLFSRSAEYLIPNIGKIPNNSVTVLKPNTRFIESFMAGLNHEFARELLWRGFPTDQRGTYFKKFWDRGDDINNPLNSTLSGVVNDIKSMHEWTNSLGTNSTISGAIDLVILVRGDLLKKFPNALIYAQKASSTTNANGSRKLDDLSLSSNALTDNDGPIHNLVRFPVLKSHIQPDVVLLGFSLPIAEAKGNGTNTGWFFVFRERPGNVRFGLDEPPTPSVSPTLGSWDDLTWAHMADTSNITDAKTVRMNTSGFTYSPPTAYPQINWNEDSSKIAWILYQKPVMIAIHADDMIE